jgi:hypothetical protein
LSGFDSMGKLVTAFADLTQVELTVIDVLYDPPDLLVAILQSVTMTALPVRTRQCLPQARRSPSYGQQIPPRGCAIDRGCRWRRVRLRKQKEALRVR